MTDHTGMAAAAVAPPAAPKIPKISSVHGSGPVAGIFHTGFTVSDLERSIAFYRDLLGLEPVTRWDSLPGRRT